MHGVYVKPWENLASAVTPDGTRLELRRHDRDYVIRAEGYDLMVSRAHGSEEAMVGLALPEPPADARVLVGGLGMGYTLGAVLAVLPPAGSVVVAELIPEVVEWNRTWLGPLAGNPLDDPRTEVVVGDVAEVIRANAGRFDAILLDVDNGPGALTQRGNGWLYTRAGLAATYEALRPGGAYALWSVGHDAKFEGHLRTAGFMPSTHPVAAHGSRGRRHVVFLGRRR
jgi:spermidine synthase